MRDRESLLAAHRHRQVVFDGACNARDLGGLPTVDGRVTRTGVVYRSDTLAYLSDPDLARLAALGVRAVVDLRATDEQQRAPDRLPNGAIALHHAGFIPNGNAEMISAVNAGRLSEQQAHTAMLGQYRRLALEHLDRFREYLDVLLGSDGTPLIFHCASGKDRTGLAAAITLLAVGVPQPLVIEDYVLSNYQRRKVDLFHAAASTAAVEQIMSADARYLEAAIAAMCEGFGSIDAYLSDGLGLNASTRAVLRDLLVA
jgi:protein-tyrosine phosphatase